MRTAVCSVISPNYRPAARVLMSSLRAHLPEWDRHVLVVGGPASIGTSNTTVEPFDAIPIDALGLPDLTELSFRYTMLELDTAVKPWLVAHLFGRGYDRVAYLDPDIVVYTRLAELDGDKQPFITLVPHLTAPVDEPGYARERSILLAGTWNLGFIAITRDPQLDAFLDWWKGRLARECVVEPERGLFVDQKWIDLVPGLFDRVAALRHDGYDVAYWNLQQRRVTRGDGDAFFVNEQPLRFFHFSGFDPSLPSFVSRHDASQKISGDVAVLFQRYVDDLKAAGYDTLRNERYAYAEFRDGSRIVDAARVAYRRSPPLQEKAGGDPFGHPELFRGIKPPKPRLTARTALHLYRLLSRARPLVRLLPRRLRTAMREGLLGRAT